MRKLDNKLGSSLKENNLQNNVLKLIQGPVLILTVIGIIGLLIRIYYFPYEIPLTHDSLLYFWYSIDLGITGDLPTATGREMYQFPNNGWPIFLSMFFSVFESDNYLAFMDLQRYVTLSISVITIIPVYLLCRRFFNKTLSLVGPAIYVFHPLITSNSLLGTTEPLFILLVTLSLYLFLSTNHKVIILSFIVLALLSTVRYEGMILFIPFSVLFILRHRKEHNFIFRYLLLAGIFILILLPVAYIRSETIGTDGLISNVLSGSGYFAASITSNSVLSDDGSGKEPLALGFTNLLKFFGIVSLPYLLFLTPYGFFKIFKEKNYLNYTLIAIGITAILPAFYAYSRDFQETRYLLVLIPILSIVSVFGIQKITELTKKYKIILVTIFLLILFSSYIYLDNQKIDYNYERNAFDFAKIVYEKTDIINGYHPEDAYLRPVIGEFSETFPKMKKLMPKSITIIQTKNFSSVTEFIDLYRDENLQYIVVDDKKDRPEFLQKIYADEKKFPYLNNVFDSNSNGYDYNVKLFFIDYEKYDEFNSP